MALPASRQRRKAGRGAFDEGVIGHGVGEHLGRIQSFEVQPGALGLVTAKAPVSALAAQHEMHSVGQGRCVRAAVVCGQNAEHGLGCAVRHRPTMPTPTEAPAAFGVVSERFSKPIEAGANLVCVQEFAAASHRLLYVG